MAKKALILGISGQDGSYLAKFLLEKGYDVIGASRDSNSTAFENLQKLKIDNYIKKVSISINDFRSVLQAINKIQPNEIYNLAGQSSVSLSFNQPVETLESIVIGNLNLLEAIRFTNLNIRYYNAGSSEMYGNCINPVNENSILNPKSPYGVSKSAAFWQVRNYREAYNLYACTGILFNHESPFRKRHFVTSKIIKSVCRIANGSNEILSLGNINIWRDWGWAPDYVEAMWKMLSIEIPSDYVISTGLTISLKDFIAYSFDYFNLNWEEYVKIETEFFRPNEIEKGISDPTKANNELGWKAKNSGEEVIQKLIECELENKYF